MQPRPRLKPSRAEKPKPAEGAGERVIPGRAIGDRRPGRERQVGQAQPASQDQLECLAVAAGGLSPQLANGGGVWMAAPPEAKAKSG
jgi:hypothetical protein